MLKKITATGILAGAATSVVLLGGPAHADRLAAGPSAVSDVYPPACYTSPGYIQPTWCANYQPAPYYPPTYYVPGTYYPGYHYGWDRWHGGWHGGWGGGFHHWHH